MRLSFLRRAAGHTLAAALVASPPSAFSQRTIDSSGASGPASVSGSACPNLPGYTSSTVPSGMVVDAVGNCVPSAAADAPEPTPDKIVGGKYLYLRFRQWGGIMYKNSSSSDAPDGGVWYRTPGEICVFILDNPSAFLSYADGNTDWAWQNILPGPDRYAELRASNDAWSQLYNLTQRTSPIPAKCWNVDPYSMPADPMNGPVRIIARSQFTFPKYTYDDYGNLYQSGKLSEVNVDGGSNGAGIKVGYALGETTPLIKKMGKGWKPLAKSTFSAAATWRLYAATYRSGISRTSGVLWDNPNNIGGVMSSYPGDGLLCSQTQCSRPLIDVPGVQYGWIYGF